MLSNTFKRENGASLVLKPSSVTQRVNHRSQGLKWDTQPVILITFMFQM